MYFSTVLLFLLSSKFIYSMNIQRVTTAPQERTENDQGTELLELGLRNGQEEELFPFIHPYTEDTKKFIEKMTRHFKISITGKMKLVMSCFPRFRKNRNHDCDTIEGSLVNDRPCKTKCAQKNRTYIKFMNKNVSLLLTASFPEQSTYRVKLNPIDSNTGTCVQRNQNFECSCTSNYQITISMSLTNEVLDSIEKVNNDDNIEITRNHDFSALLLILKFYPIAAPLFVAYLFMEYGLDSVKSEFDPSDFAGLNIEENLENANNVAPENVAGVIDDKGSLVEKEEQVFQIIIQQVSSAKSCDLHALAYKYLNEREIFTVIIFTFIFVMLIDEAGLTYVMSKAGYFKHLF